MPTVYRDPASGQEINLPDDATPQEIEMIANKHFPSQPSTVQDHMNVLRNAYEKNKVENTIPAIASKARDLLPAVGGILGSIPGAGAGAFAKQALSPTPSLQEGAIDLGLQGVLPEAAGKLTGILQSLRSNGVRQTLANLLPTSLASKLPATKIAETINKARGMLSPEAGMIETAGENARNQIPYSKPGQVLHGVTPANYQGTVAEDLVQTPYTQQSVAKIPPIGKTADKLFSDVTEVRNAKIATGDPTVIRQLAQDRILRKNWNFDNGSFNPSNVLDELGKSEDVYKEALGNGYDTFKNLMQTAKELKVGEHPESLISWHEVRKVGALSLGAEIIGVPYHLSAPVILSVDAMKKIASDPALGQLIVAGMKLPKTSPASTLLGKAIANGLRGTTVYLQGEDGQKSKATFGEDGQLQTPPPSPK